MDQRKEFVLEAMDPLCNFTKLCSKYGISTKTGYKWKSRFIQEEFAGLFDQSKRPDNSPTQIPEEIILEIIKLKIKKKHWGPKKIREIYRQKHPEENIPCLTSVERILRKAGLIKKEKGIGPGKPQQNGSHKRMHLDMKNELESCIEGNILLHQKEFDRMA